MEIKINPNWSAETYVKKEGVYAAYQVNNPGPGNFWFFSSVSFNINEVIRITQGTNVSICRVESVDPSIILSYNIIVKRITGSPNLNTITSIELYDNDQEYYLDGTIDLGLNLRILDLKELKRSSPFTKTIEVPFTDNNNKIFTQIFNVNVVEGFNPKKKSDCVITDGGVLISSGYLQVQNVDLSNKIYKCVFYGENKNLFDDIGDNYIFGNRDATADINLDNLIHNKLKADFDKAWSNTQDYNYGLFTTDLDVYTLDYMKGVGSSTGVEPFRWKPLVRAKAVLDAIFNKWGYTYESDFLESDTRFTDLFVLPSLEPALGGTILKYKQNDPPTTWTITTGVDNTIPLYVLDIDPWGNKYNFSTNRFTVPYTDTWRVSLALSIDSRATVWYGINKAQRDAAIDAGEIGVKVYRRGVLIDRQIIKSISGFAVLRPGASMGPGKPTTPPAYGYNPIGWQKISVDGFQFNNRFSEGDELEFYVKITKSNFSTYTVNGLYNDPNNKVDFIALLNDAITTNLISLFNGLKQSDFVGDMFKMFNLYIKPDKLNPRKFIIEPRDDFYRKGKVVSNLEYDVNTVDISYLNDLAAKKYIFTYAKGEDQFNKDFSQANRDRIFGDAIITLDNDFLTSEKKISLSGVSTETSATDGTNNIVLPNLKGAPAKDKMRYFYYGGMVQTSQTFKYLLYQSNITNLTVYTYSTYPGFSNYQVFNDTNSDSILFAENSSGEKEASLYYNYYENEIETYAEPGSHILTIDVKMNTKVFSSIDYNDIYYLEVNGNPAYYILLSIENYKPDQTDMVKMKFMSYYDFRSTKPKRSRPFWDVGQVGIGDNPRDSQFVGDLKPIGGGVVSGGGGIKNGGVGTIEGGVLAGTDIAIGGNNKNIFVVGDKTTVAQDVKNVFSFGEEGGLITQSNIVSFGGKGKTFSAEGTFNFNEFNPVIEKQNIGSVSNPQDGMLIYTGDALSVYRGSSGTYSFLSLTQSFSGSSGSSGIDGSSGSSGSSGSDGSSGTSGTSPTIDTYTWFLATNQKFATASQYFSLDTWTDSTGGSWYISAQVYCGATAGSGDIQQTMSIRLTDGGGVVYASAESNINFPLNAYTTISLSTIVSTSAGNSVVLEIASTGAGGFEVFNSLQANPTADKATQWNIFRLSY